MDFIGENDERMDDVSHDGKMTMEKGWKAGWFWMILFLGVFGKIDRKLAWTNEQTKIRNGGTCDLARTCSMKIAKQPTPTTITSTFCLCYKRIVWPVWFWLFRGSHGHWRIVPKIPKGSRFTSETSPPDTAKYKKYTWIINISNTSSQVWNGDPARNNYDMMPRFLSMLCWEMKLEPLSDMLWIVLDPMV